MHTSTVCSMKQDSWEELRDKACSKHSSNATTSKVLKEIHCKYCQDKNGSGSKDRAYLIEWISTSFKQTNLAEEKYYSYSCIPKDITRKSQITAQIQY